ncbi:MAG TPA: hypothetical protein VKX25_11090 [Bryobacteraceae bacterium]|nr:hypothetical protein [Bryobacteraceae bacterium]
MIRTPKASSFALLAGVVLCLISTHPCRAADSYQEFFGQVAQICGLPADSPRAQIAANCSQKIFEMGKQAEATKPQTALKAYTIAWILEQSLGDAKNTALFQSAASKTEELSARLGVKSPIANLSVPALPTVNPAAPARSNAIASSSTSQSTPALAASSQAAGVGDWSSLLGNYVCFYYGYTGGMQYVGGMLQPNFGMVRVGVDIQLLSSSSYQTTKAPAASFSFSTSIPGKTQPAALGMITFTNGSMSGHRAILETDKQYKYHMLFPNDWKTPDGKSDSLSSSTTYCYQQH